MPATTSSKSASAANNQARSSSFMNDYLADWDDDDPFRSPSPEPAKKDDRKKDVLGIEKELDLKRKPRKPRVKLDEARLLSEKGIPKLRKMAPKLKLKGKGHEFSDAARILTFYQEWLDDLFPKATFLDALAMVEKAGHKTALRNARMRWLDEDRPKTVSDDIFADENVDGGGEDNRIYQTERRRQDGDGGRVAPVFEKAAAAAAAGAERAKTPPGGLFGDEDIYDATPRKDVGSGTAAGRQVVDDGVPDEDDLDALMAEVDAAAEDRSKQQTASGLPGGSIFGNGSRTLARPSAGEPDQDDLDALIAEAEAEAAQSASAGAVGKSSMFGDGKRKPETTQGGFGEDEDDLDALMALAEAETAAAQPGTNKEPASGNPQPRPQPAQRADGSDDGDDLDALMAEAEAGVESGSLGGGKDGPPKPADSAHNPPSYEAEEEVMAEMEGLW